jgi:hypothetical protein
MTSFAMTRAAFVLTAALLLIVRPTVKAQHGEWTVFTPATDVSFTITPTQSRYHVGETITLKYDVVNVSNRALFVSKVMCPPPVMAWLENSAGGHVGGVHAFSCLGPAGGSISDRMRLEAQLLKPGERLSNTASVDTKDLAPGDYRVEAVFYGWKPEALSDADLAELAKFGSPFLRGEIPASGRITLTR